ncbi:hypothetical protein HDU85_004298 [Gaertneriomyces sp. JEL0708]|nr:hypothetical protein HDU85_004298 [Gaertneriomyces sp. JEL0708]
MATNDEESYYDLLGVQSSASREEIKKAYRRLALRYHPDKTGSDPAATDRFQRIVKAHEILSDERKRQVYDGYGEAGLELFGQATPAHHSALLATNYYFIFGSILLAILILFPSFVALRADHRVKWSWGVVFAPLYLFECAAALAYFFDRRSYEQDYEQLEDEDETANFAENRSDTFAQREKNMRRKAAAKWKEAFMSLFLFALVLTFQTLIMVNLDRRSFPWSVVPIPWFILEAYGLWISLYTLIEKIARGVAPLPPMYPDPESYGATAVPQPRQLMLEEKLFACLAWCSFPIYRIVQLILLMARLDDKVTWAWPLVFLPTWIFGVFHIGVLVLRRRRQEKLAASGMASDFLPKEFFIAQALVTCSLWVFAYSFFILLVVRLQNELRNRHVPLATIVLIPMFIILGLCFCCTCCLCPLGHKLMKHTMKTGKFRARPDSANNDDPEATLGQGHAAGSSHDRSVP